MNLITNILRSSLGKKFHHGHERFALSFFVIGHLAGNLQFSSAAKPSIATATSYKPIRTNLAGPSVLALMVSLHIWAAAKLSLENKAAGPLGYDQYQPVGSSYASRTMLMSGLIIFYIFCLSYSPFHGSGAMHQSDWERFPEIR